MKNFVLLSALILCILLLSVSPLPSLAQSPTAPADPSDATTRQSRLEDRQEALRVRFSRFEETLLKMAQFLQKTEPARAELVLRALERSKQERVGERMNLVTRMLTKDAEKGIEFADAIGEQEQIIASLKEILTILRSEDILDENRKEQERLEALAREIGSLIDKEKVNAAATQRGEPTDRAKQGQESTEKQTGDLIAKIAEHDGSQKSDSEKSDSEKSDSEKSDSEKSDSEKSDSEKSDSEKSDSEKSDSQKSDSEKSDSQKSDSEKSDSQKSDSQKSDSQKSDSQKSDSQKSDSQKSDSQKSDSQKSDSQKSDSQKSDSQKSDSQKSDSQKSDSQKSDSQKSDSQKSDSQKSDSQKSDSQKRQQTPGRERLEQARQQMQKAIEELENKQRENATEAQREAIDKLIEAKEEIEELLRQLREEERELLLRALEARFQKMLQLQQVVLEKTEPLSQRTKETWEDRDFARCRDSAALEREIGLEATKALEVLKADGSSVAFPEAVVQLDEDIRSVIARLSDENCGSLTILIEQDIVAALQEIVVALQKEMQKNRDEQGQPPGEQQQDQKKDPSLVDKLAELKMLKTLQMRINRRTAHLSEMFEGDQATDPEVAEQLQELAARQGRLQRATYDMAVQGSTK